MSKSIKSIAVVGCGQMGMGIAQVATLSGFMVELADNRPEIAVKSKEKIIAQVKKLAEKGKYRESDVVMIENNLSVAKNFEQLASVDFVIEAISENLALKKELFSLLDKIIQPQAIFASNTSSISLTAMAAATQRPQQIIGMHFMNPVPVMQLVELIRAIQTSDETYSTTRLLAEKMNKTLVVSKEAPGFIVNRILMPMINEAFFALDEGLASAVDIDTAMKLGTNQPMGPLTLADFIGLDTVLAILEVLHRELGEDKYRPSPLLRRYVAAGWLGKKSGRGVHVY